MVNVNKLKGKIVECGLSIEELAKRIGKDRATLYRRLNSDGKDFTIEEADLIAKTLNLTYSEVNAIFFNQYVA
jgi:Helix-turn-helix.